MSNKLIATYYDLALYNKYCQYSYPQLLLLMGNRKIKEPKKMIIERAILTSYPKMLHVRSTQFEHDLSKPPVEVELRPLKEIQNNFVKPVKDVVVKGKGKLITTREDVSDIVSVPNTYCCGDRVEFLSKDKSEVIGVGTIKSNKYYENRPDLYYVLVALDDTSGGLQKIQRKQVTYKRVRLLKK